MDKDCTFSKEGMVYTFHHMFPELKESEDERIRKELIENFKWFCGDYPETTKWGKDDNLLVKDILAWLEKQGKIIDEYEDKLDRCACKSFDKGYKAALEKQGEQKPTDNVEPKFNVGDWVVCCNYEPEQIIGIRNDMYEMSNGDIRPIKMINNNHNIRLWTIQDAKDGDVLASKDIVFIFKHIDKTVPNLCKSYCEVIGNSGLGLGFDFSINGVHPATKEQRDLLFSKMKEAGYEWDAENKVLREIERRTTSGEENERIRKALVKYLEVLDDEEIRYGVSFKEMRSWLEKQREQTTDKIIERARTEKQRVLLTETNGDAHIDWDCRSLRDVKLLLKYGLGYIDAQLEKQGEQTPVDKPEPKFKVGDWVVSPNGVYWHIDAIRDSRYQVSSDLGYCADWPLNTNIYHKFTIQDAKDGDVLVDNYGNILLYEGISSHTLYDSYCFGNEKYFIEQEGAHMIECTYPATKEQRDLLFRKMKEAGYEWDAEKKELRKIKSGSAGDGEYGKDD